MIPRTTGTAKPDCLLIEGCDFSTYPPGGQLATAKQLMRAFGPRLALVGICTDDVTPIGRWIERDFEGGRFLFYGIGRAVVTAARPLVPARITEAVRLARHRNGIMSLGVRAALMRAPEDLIIVARWSLDSICYWFPGVANPLEAPRYRGARIFAGLFDRLLFTALNRADTILASADEASIDLLAHRSGGRLRRDRIRPLPTHYDSSIFFPADQMAAVRTFGIEGAGPLVVCSGRLNRVKGWDLVLAAFRLFRLGRPSAHLVFVGDGEDRGLVDAAITRAGLEGSVTVTGFTTPREVALWLNAADVVVVGSHKEGWSVAMLEALACGKPVVSTAVSGAATMISEGKNGFIVKSRSPDEFSAAMSWALLLPQARAISTAHAKEFDTARLAYRVGEAWPVLS